MEPHKIWIEQCEAAESIENEFGTQKALDCLVGEKFLNFIEVAETEADFRAGISEFVAKIKTMFERWQMAQYLDTARQTELFDPSLFEPRSHARLGEEETGFDADEIEEMRKDDIRQCTRDLLLVERAREWLLEAEARNIANPLIAKRARSVAAGVLGVRRPTYREACEAPGLSLPHNQRNVL
jgi:hypothetical protein